MGRDKYRNRYGDEFGKAIDQLIKELGIRSRSRLWEIAGVGTNRDCWYDRANGKVQTDRDDIDTLIQGLADTDYRLSQQQQERLYASIGVKLIRQTEQPDRMVQLDAALDPDRQYLLERRLAEFVVGTRQNELAEVMQCIEQLKPTGGYLMITGRAKARQR